MLQFFLSIVLCSIISFACTAQSTLEEILPVKNGKVNFTEVLEINDTSVEELYSRAKNWLIISNKLHSIKEYNNNNFEKIKSTGNIKVLWGPNNYPELYLTINYTIRLNFRTDRYRYEFTNFIVKKPGAEIQLEIYKMQNKKNKKYNKLFYKNIKEQMQIIIDSLVRTMTIKNLQIE